MKKKPGFLMGTLIGAILTIPLLAVFYGGTQLANLPFVPDFVFGFARDITPGEIVPRTIQGMVDVILALRLGPVDDVGKTSEQLIALGMFLVMGIVVGAVFFAVLRAALKQRTDALPGVILGLVLGIPMTLLVFRNPLLIRTDTIFTVIWIVGLFLLYGLAMSYVYNVLAFRARATQPITDNSTAAASVEGMDRRSFLVRVGGTAAVITVVGAGVGALLNRSQNTPNVTAAPTPRPDATAEATAEATSVATDGSQFVKAQGTRPEVTPLAEHYRIDINTFIPVVDGVGYTLPFTTSLTEDSSTQTVAALTVDDIRNNYEAVSDYLTMSCISNRVAGTLIGTTLWTGARMRDILNDMDIPQGATHLKITAADGFDEFVALDLILNDERVLLTYDWGGEPLTDEHGFPLRIHIPNHYGMKQPKWITGIEFVNSDPGGYWVRRGWDAQALVKTTSVIDTVAVDDRFESAAGEMMIPIGGIAWSGDRGISRVEVRVDDGEFQEALLKAPLSDRTWYLWRYDWPYSEGAHNFTVRAFEGDGTMQIESEAGTFPSGATGFHSVSAAV